MELTTTLNEIREHDPCAEGWEKALRYLGKTSADDEPLPLLTILESNGIDDAVWGLRVLDVKYDNAVRLFVCFCARYCLDIFEKEYSDDNRPRLAIETAERYAMGLATKEELTAAWAIAWDVAWASARVARATTSAVIWATDRDARDAAWAAVRDARAAALAAALDARVCLADEFKRLCLLEGEYGDVIRKDI